MSVFDTFEKKRDYLICVDSDGCAMDTMKCKHERCFGPCMVERWELDEWKDDILYRWDYINLYSMTRGINRFKGLAMALEEIDKQYKRIIGVKTLVEWANTSPKLSNDALLEAVEKCDDLDGKQCLYMAYLWSVAVNESIENLHDSLKVPFVGALEGLKEAHEFADVAVVSSANRDAVEKEWADHGLSDHVDILLTQDCGSKAHCIAEMLKKGYSPDRVLMVGDAPGDLDAADKNGVLCFPILVGAEMTSWADFRRVALENLKNGKYAGEYQADVKEKFYKNLGAR